MNDHPGLALAQVRDRRADGARGAEQVHLEHRLQIGLVDRLERSGQAGARIVDQCVEPAEAFRRASHRRLDPGFVGHVHRQAGDVGLVRPAADPFDGARARHHVPALAGEQLCRGLADAAGGASDQNRFHVHGWFLAARPRR